MRCRVISGNKYLHGVIKQPVYFTVALVIIFPPVQRPNRPLGSTSEVSDPQPVLEQPLYFAVTLVVLQTPRFHQVGALQC